MVKIGHLPAGNSQGWGYMASGTARSTYIGRFEKAVWLTRVGIRAGRYDLDNPAVSVFLHTGSSPDNFLLETSNRSVTKRMIDQFGGENIEWSLSGIGVNANIPICGGLAAHSGRIGYGQDNSGEVMYFNVNNNNLDPYAISSQSPQGRIHISIEAQENRQPNKPLVISPPDGKTVVDPTPEITIEHRDPDLSYGDEFSAYKIEIWNAANTQIVEGSGKQSTDAGEKSANRASWSPTTLSPGSYTIRAITYDAMGVASPTKTSTFSFASGGAQPMLEINAPAIVGTMVHNNVDIPIINDTTPQFRLLWTSDGSNTSTISIRIRTFTNLIEEVLGGPVVEYRSSYTFFQTVTPGNDIVINYPGSWAAIERGTPGPYILEARVTDSMSFTTDWVGWQIFAVNAYPSITLQEPPSSSSHAVPPMLEATWDDVTPEITAEVTAEFDVDPPDGGPIQRYAAQGVNETTFVLQLNHGHLGDLGTARFRAVVTDEFGLSNVTSWRTFFYVEPPDVDILSPTDQQVLTVGDFTVDWTVDDTQAKYRLVIREGATVWYDTGVINSSTTSHYVPPGIMPNDASFEAEVWIETSGGIAGSATREFSIDYPSPDPLSGVFFTQERSSTYDRPNDALNEQLPNIEVQWGRAESNIQPIGSDWYAYGIEREHPVTGEIVRWEVYDRNQLRFVDTSPAANTNYTYRAYAMWWVNDGAGIVKSEYVENQVAADIKYVVLRSESADDEAVTLHLWENRTVSKHYDGVVVRGWDELPIIKQGVAHDRNIRISAVLLSHPEGWFTALDLLQSIEAMAKSVKNPDGTWRPRVLNYSDPYGRAMRCVMKPPRVTDHHMKGRIAVDIEIQEHR